MPAFTDMPIFSSSLARSSSTSTLRRTPLMRTPRGPLHRALAHIPPCTVGPPSTPTTSSVRDGSIAWPHRARPQAPPHARHPIEFHVADAKVAPKPRPLEHGWGLHPRSVLSTSLSLLRLSFFHPNVSRRSHGGRHRSRGAPRTATTPLWQEHQVRSLYLEAGRPRFSLKTTSRGSSKCLRSAPPRTILAEGGHVGSQP